MWVWPQLTRTVDPTAEPLTLAQAKAQCLIGDDDPQHDTWLADAIKSARELTEEMTQCPMMQSTWQLRLDDWPDDTDSEFGIDLIVHPARSITSVKYYDTAGTLITYSSTNYELITGRRRSKIAKADSGTEWPAVSATKPGPITILFVCGYSTSSTVATAQAAVPSTFKHAMRMLISHWFEHRETVIVGSISKEIELSFDALLNATSPLQYA